jgi:peptidoglycan/xylan/chitin deacetylase (PgdA/CDA1 family)
MPMKRSLLILPLIMLLIAAACSAPNPPADHADGTGGSPMNDVPSPSAPDESAGSDEQPDEPNEAGKSETEPDSDSQDPPDAQDPDRDAPPAETVKTHYMNRNYIFKPIDPEGEKKVVLLTFDDGPKDETMIDSLLATLEKHEAKAIFFLNGFRVEANPDLARKLHERGQILGNHSWDHIVLTEQSEETIDAQISRVQDILEELTGTAPKFFRPPHGAGNEYIRTRVREAGMLYMTWSNGSRDWEKGYQTPESVVEQVLKQLHPGSNILMHELPWTVEALDTLLTRLEEEGYSFLDPDAIDIDYEEPASS